MEAGRFVKKAYLDYNATTPLDPAVRQVMIEAMEEIQANPSSFHQPGQKARHAIERAREEIAYEIGAEPGDLIFTSGGTEADNLAVKGASLTMLERGRKKVILSAIEHQAVLQPAKTLADQGFQVVYIQADDCARVDLDVLEKEIDDHTALVSVMHANNEVGTFQDVSVIAGKVHARGALFHVDAVQTFGKYRLDVEEVQADLLSLSAHKICGPKGVGALYIKKGVKIKAQQHGGHQEKNIRPGTENVHGIIGFGKAAQLAAKARERDRLHAQPLRDQFEKNIINRLDGVRINGALDNRLYQTSSLSFDGLDGETLLMNLDLKHVYVSTGSACTAGSVEPSHVLLAMGRNQNEARGTIRVSLGRFTTSSEMDHAAQVLIETVERLRRSRTGA